MRLIRFGEKGKERPGLLKEDRIIDLREHFPEIPDIDRDFFEKGWIERVRTLTAEGRPQKVRLGPPLTRPSKIVCLGRNYADHAKEGGNERPQRPLLFCKAPSALNGPYDPILLPKSSHQVDWEVELAVVIGRRARRVDRRRAADYIAGFCTANDVSGRDAQFADSQWFRGKSFDTFAPLGPALVTPDEVGDWTNLRLTATVSGKVMQEGTTADMLFDVGAIIEDITCDITLEAGDVIFTGTPAGVGIFRDPPVLLKNGDVVECAIEGIGAIRNEIVDTIS
ncbi:MAG: fumarylacetoacetate hydrolase family protein [Desulfobacterales bacterium]|nr:fumarylacetoacetate hydrolase family protein [Desulfobacterales bacterium]